MSQIKVALGKQSALDCHPHKEGCDKTCVCNCGVTFRGQPNKQKVVMGLDGVKRCAGCGCRKKVPGVPVAMPVPKAKTPLLYTKAA